MVLKNTWIFSAFALAVLMAGIHVFVGGRLIARPLLESDLADLPRLTLYLCWHGITIVLAGMALLYADGLFWRRRRDSVIVASGLAAAFFGLGWALILAFGLSPLDLPQWIVFGPMGIFGWLGVRNAQARK